VAIGIASTLLLSIPAIAAGQLVLAYFFGLMVLTLLYCLGNVLLIQGLPGARWAHNLLLASLLLLSLASALSRAPGALYLLSLAACLGGLALSNSKTYRSMQALHALIRQLRRQHGLRRRLP